jgi:hypothetical protein
LVFRDPLAFVDRAGTDEERWITLGETSAGEMLVVVQYLDRYY